MIDFGVDKINLDFNIGLEEPKKKGKKKEVPYNPKDPFQMNQMADDMKKDTEEMVNDVKKDIEDFKQTYHAIKGEVMPIVDEFRGFFAEQKAKKQLKMIQAFGTTRKAKLLMKENPKIDK
jgi:hypothetical protein